MKIPEGEPDTLVLHQSDIKHFLSCPDQFRVVNNVTPGGDFNKDPGMRMETDAASVGTVLHSVIEHDLRVGFKSLSDAERWAKNEFGNLVFSYVTDGLTYRTESFGDDPVKTEWNVKEPGARMWGHVQQDEHLIGCLREGKQPSITPDDGRKAMEVALQIAKP